MQNIFWKSTIALSAMALMSNMVNAEAEVKVDEGVLVLTDANFDEQTKKHSTGLLVEFYAPWCGHCKSLAPEYASAAGKLGAMTPPRFLGKVDATVQEKTAKRFGVDGYPTLKWFVDSEAQEYGGGRTADTIVSWIMKKTGPPSSTLACADLDAEVAKNKLSLVLFGEQTTEMGQAFLTEAKESEKASFYHTTADCAAAHGAKADGLMLFRNFDEPKIAYEGKADAVDMEAFVKANSVAQLFEFSDNSVEAIFHNNSPAIVWFGEGKPPAGFEAASKTMKGKILFTYSGISEGIQEQLGEFVGVTKIDMPCIRIIKPTESGVTKFKYEGAMDALTGESVSEFVQNWTDNKLTAFRKSEEVPADNNGPVRVVIGTTFETEVMKSENETLMKFYAPWCGHCTSLAPHWTALGEDVKGIKGLVVAKFDATKNEAEGVEVESFPTLKFYKGGNATEVKFNHEEGKQVGSLKNFLIANSATYKAARPDEKADPALDAKDEAPAEEGEGEEPGMPEGEEKDMGDGKIEGEYSEEEMKKIEEEMDKMSPEEKAKMEKEMADAGANMGEGEMTEDAGDVEAGDDAGDVGGEPKGDAEAAPADEKKEDL